MKSGEGDDVALRRILKEKFSLESGFKRRNLLGIWWRPNFEIYTVSFVYDVFRFNSFSILIVLLMLVDPKNRSKSF
jgi:hypothetical protein